MDIFELLNETAYSKDFLTYAKNLKIFSERALTEKNRARIVKIFYERMREMGLREYLFEDLLSKDSSRYTVYEGAAAVHTYMALNAPKQETPVRTLRNLQGFSETLLEEFSEPKGAHIEKDQVLQIMNYLDETFSFSEKVFSDRKAIFLILDVSHVLYNSLCQVWTGEELVIQHIFLYGMRDTDGQVSPEAVFFHELGHALHARFSKTIERVPEEYLQFLEKLCMPGIRDISVAEQSEVFADVLSMGLMYGSPFDIYDPFPQIHHEDKQAFRFIVSDMLSKI